MPLVSLTFEADPVPKLYEIRADYDAETIVVYQAYPRAIARPALEAQRFVAPFSFGRMTWCKPSFLWLTVRVKGVVHPIMRWARLLAPPCRLPSPG